MSPESGNRFRDNDMRKNRSLKRKERIRKIAMRFRKSCRRPMEMQMARSFDRAICFDPRFSQLQPLVAPQVSHFSQVPFRTMVKLWHSEHSLPV